MYGIYFFYTVERKYMCFLSTKKRLETIWACEQCRRNGADPILLERKPFYTSMQTFKPSQPIVFNRRGTKGHKQKIKKIVRSL
jgi:hypothetical protein